MNKTQQIGQTALQLFAERGFNQTPTALIAKEAQVSEALIFKYFGSKNQLLEHIVKSGYQRITEQNRGMMTETNPQRMLDRIIGLPYQLVADERDFWRLQAQLMDKDFIQRHYQRFLHPVHERLTTAFCQLDYEQPQLAAYHLLILIEGLWKSLIQKEMPAYLPDLKVYIKQQYALPIPGRMKA